MKIALLQSTDRMAWNDFVARAPSGHILQSWEWGEIKARSGWRAVRLALQDDDGIRAGAQILIRTLPYGFGRLAYVPKGPVLDYSDPALLRSMLAILRSFADRERVVSLKIEPEVVEPSAVPNLLLGVGLKAALPV
ncbi:MAG TPA: peptidoglycan bridge formation glycyltransferase FemA/FemB family protein, partial [Chloroflexota bacterium]